MKFSRFVYAFFSIVGMVFPAYTAAQTTDTSVISSVTVYSDRAMVTRKVPVVLEPGDNTVVLEHLPYELDPASVRVEGKGDMVLKDVKVSDRFLSDVYSERLRDLVTEKERFTDKLKEYRDREAEAESGKSFVRGIVSVLTKPSEGAAERELDPDKWIKMADFYRNSLKNLNDDLRKTRKLIKDISKEIDRIDREINSIGRNRKDSVKEIEIILSSGKQGKGFLEVSYMVKGPTWIPDYTVQVDDGKDSVSLFYKAFVFQSTGENWDNVELSLSTAKPAVGGDLPELSPWYLELRDPDDYRTASRGLFTAAAPAPLMKKAEEDAFTSGEPPAEELPDLGYAVSGLKTGLTSVVFRLSGKNSVASDNQKHSVTVAVFDLPAEFSYSCVPKLSPFVYLQAEVENKSEYPFLPGETRVFLGGDFVAKATMDMVSPGEKFRIDLGIDEGFSVERKLADKKESSGGFLSRKIKAYYEYSIEIRNNKSGTNKIEIWDQLPVSMEKNIIVTPVKSPPADDDGYVKWVRTIAPGESTGIVFSFSVEYPKDVIIDNIE